MAIISKGILGGFSGKVGNVVGGNWRGIQYIRSLPKKVKRIPTLSQLEQRAKFTLAIGFLNKVKPAITLGFQNSGKDMSTPINEACRQFLKTSISGRFPVYGINYQQVQLSKGALPSLKQTNLKVVDGMLKLTWSFTNRRSEGDGDDQVILVIYAVDRSVVELVDTGTRKDGQVDFQISNELAGREVAAWVFSYNRKAKVASDSQFLGLTNLI